LHVITDRGLDDPVLATRSWGSVGTLFSRRVLEEPLCFFSLGKDGEFFTSPAPINRIY
jgi:hypothetical protein